MELKAIAPGECQKIHGQLMKGTTHNLPIQINQSIKPALELPLMKISNILFILFLTNTCQKRIYQPIGIGGMFLELTISPSPEINTFPVIVEVVGLLQPQVP